MTQDASMRPMCRPDVRFALQVVDLSGDPQACDNLPGMPPVENSPRAPSRVWQFGNKRRRSNVRGGT